jgi:predicted Zn-dependent peptidase
VSVERSSDRGQALPMVVLLLGVGLVAVLLVVHVGSQANQQAQAQTAADAAALAGASTGRLAAAQMAEINGGVLQVFEVQGSSVQVVVSIGAAQAEARAVRRVRWIVPE